jgi:hypothetical protein
MLKDFDMKLAIFLELLGALILKRRDEIGLLVLRYFEATVEE